MTEDSVALTDGVLKEAEDYVSKLVVNYGKDTAIKLITESSIDLGCETRRDVSDFVSGLIYH